MATIKYYDNGDTVTSVVPHLAHWVVNNSNRFDRLYICRDEVSVETSVHNDDITDEMLLNTDAVWHISPLPFGPEVWIPLIVSVVVGVVSAVLFQPEIPESPTNSNKTSSNALQSRGNDPRLDKRLPDIRGREPKAYPDLWSSYLKFRNNREYETSFLCLSTGTVDVDTTTLVDGDTLLADIQGASAEFYGPNTSPNSGDAPYLTIGDPIGEYLYAVRRSNEVDGARLPAPNEGEVGGTFEAFVQGFIRTTNTELDLGAYYLPGDDADLTGFYSFEQHTDIGTGEVYYTRHDASGTYKVIGAFEQDLTLNITTNPDPWQYFGNVLVLTQAWQSVTDPAKWQISSPTVPTDWILVEWSQTVKNTAVKAVGPFDCSDVSEIWINLIAQNGIYKKSQRPVFFDIEFDITVADKNSAAKTTTRVTMSSNLEDAVKSTFEIPVPYTKATVSVTRITDTDYEFSGNVSDEVKWRDLYLVNNVTKSHFGNVTTILSRTQATDSALRQKERKLSMSCVRYITRHDGTYVASDEFADIIYSMHIDPFIGRRTAATLDITGLYALQEQIVAYYGRGRDPVRCGYTFDDDTLRYEDHLRLICDAVNVQPYQVGNTIKFHFEGPQAFSTQLFGHRSKVPGGEERRTRSLYPKDDYDGVELTYKDAVTGDFETIYVPADQSATNPEVVKYDGCFIERNAQVRADRLRNKQLFQRVTHEFDALDKARLLAQGQRIDVVDNTRYAPNNGYIDTVAGLEYYLSQPTDLAVGTQASIVLTKRDGSLEGVPVTVLDDDAVQLAYAPMEAPYTGYLADRTEYSLAVDDERSKMAMLVSKIEPRDVDNVKVTCINYDERYYSKDL